MWRSYQTTSLASITGNPEILSLESASQNLVAMPILPNILVTCSKLYYKASQASPVIHGANAFTTTTGRALIFCEQIQLQSKHFRNINLQQGNASIRDLEGLIKKLAVSKHLETLIIGPSFSGSIWARKRETYTNKVSKILYEWVKAQQLERGGPTKEPMELLRLEICSPQMRYGDWMRKYLLDIEQQLVKNLAEGERAED